MTELQFHAAYRAFWRRRPFRAFLIEFMSGTHLQIGHPDVVRHEDQFHVARRPDGGYVVFTAESVSRLLDVPTPAKS